MGSSSTSGDSPGTYGYSPVGSTSHNRLPDHGSCRLQLPSTLAECTEFGKYLSMSVCLLSVSMSFQTGPNRKAKSEGQNPDSRRQSKTNTSATPRDTYRQQLPESSFHISPHNPQLFSETVGRRGRLIELEPARRAEQRAFYRTSLALSKPEISGFKFCIRYTLKVVHW